jgi:hypothetical protein
LRGFGLLLKPLRMTGKKLLLLAAAMRAVTSDFDTVK